MQKRFRFKREAHGKKATKGGLDYVEFVRSSKCSAKLFYGWTYPDMNDMKKVGCNTMAAFGNFCSKSIRDKP